MGYRLYEQFDDQTLPIKSAAEKDRSQTIIPAYQIAPEWALLYGIEALDSAGNGQTEPHLK